MRVYGGDTATEIADRIKDKYSEIEIIIAPGDEDVIFGSPAPMCFKITNAAAARNKITLNYSRNKDDLIEGFVIYFNGNILGWNDTFLTPKIVKVGSDGSLQQDWGDKEVFIANNGTVFTAEKDDQYKDTGTAFRFNPDGTTVEVPYDNFMLVNKATIQDGRQLYSHRPINFTDIEIDNFDNVICATVDNQFHSYHERNFGNIKKYSPDMDTLLWSKRIPSAARCTHDKNNNIYLQGFSTPPHIGLEFLGAEAGLSGSTIARARGTHKGIHFHPLGIISGGHFKFKVKLTEASGHIVGDSSEILFSWDTTANQLASNIESATNGFYVAGTDFTVTFGPIYKDTMIINLIRDKIDVYRFMFDIEVWHERSSDSRSSRSRLKVGYYDEVTIAHQLRLRGSHIDLFKMNEDGYITWMDSWLGPAGKYNFGGVRIAGTGMVADDTRLHVVGKRYENHIKISGEPSYFKTSGNIHDSTS